MLDRGQKDLTELELPLAERRGEAAGEHGGTRRLGRGPEGTGVSGGISSGKAVCSGMAAAQVAGYRRGV